MKYNSVRTRLVIPEYGRNVQQLVEHAKTIEDKEYRQAFTEEIVDLIYSMHPQTRNIEDYRGKLWAHVIRISDYELDVTIPDTVTTQPVESLRPDPLRYPIEDVRFRHYGRHVQQLINKAVEMEDEDMKNEFSLIIASYMKMAYNSWNRINVSDEIIKGDLKKLSKGEIVIDENTPLENTNRYSKRKGKKHSSNHKKGRNYKKRR